MIGGGPAGQAAAVLLARAGWAVSLFERSAAMGPVGAGLLVQPTGMSVLDRLGVGGELRGLASPVRRLSGLTDTGRVVMDLSYGDLRPGLVGYGLQRSAIAGALAGAMRVAGVGVHMAHEARAVRRGSRRLTIEFKDAPPRGPFDLAVIAAGARTALRDSTGLVIRDRPYPWGALWFMGLDAPGRFEGSLRQVYRGASQMIGVLPSGRAAPEAAPAVSLFWSLRARDWPGHAGFDLQAWKARAAALAPDFAPLLDQVDRPERLVYAPYRDVVLRRPNDGPVVFIGDAAHAMSPQLGQGVNLGLLDAAALADALGEGPTIERALAGYAAARRAHVAFYSMASRWLTPFFQSDARALGALRDAAMGPAGRVPWLRRQMLLSLAGVKTGVLGRLGSWGG